MNKLEIIIVIAAVIFIIAMVFFFLKTAEAIIEEIKTAPYENPMETVKRGEGDDTLPPILCAEQEETSPKETEPEQLEPTYAQYVEEEYLITAYCPCEKCCGKTDRITATGTVATEGRTIAVDPSVIPYGTEVVIDGNTYVAEDCGGLVNGNKIDLFFGNHDQALKWGAQVKEVRIYDRG